jgi:Tol biopolymer transport system component
MRFVALVVTTALAVLVGLIVALVCSMSILFEGDDDLADLFTPHNLYSFDAPAWSPDGTRLAFVSSKRDSLGLYVGTDIYLMTADGSDPHPVYSYGVIPSPLEDPAWSPDGKTLAFATPPGIAVMNADGSTPAGMAREVLVEGASPSWSPDGSRLAYASKGLIMLVNVDGGDARPLTDGANPAWSPDGSLIAYEKQSAVWLAGLDGSEPRRLTVGSEPAWAPDGRRLAVVRRTGIDVEETYIVELDGQGEMRLTSGDSPAWSPVADRIALHRGTDILVVDSDGSHITALARGSERCGRLSD